MPAPSVTARVPSTTVLRQLMGARWFSDSRIHGVRVADALGQVASFDVRDGALAPTNDVATTMRGTSTGARVTSRLESALAVDPERVTIREVLVVDPTEGGVRPRSRRRSRVALVATGVAGASASLAGWLETVSPRTRRTVLAELRTGSPRARSIVAQVFSQMFDPGMDAGVLDLDRLLVAPRTTNLLASASATYPRFGTRYVAEVLAHEFEHAVSPADPAAPANERIGWLEEGGADTLARWPGVAQRYAAAMGLDAPPRAPRLDLALAYDRMTSVVRRLLVLAGIDVARADELDRARDLLQGGTLADAPRRLAAAIAGAHPGAAIGAPAIERAIRAIDGDPAAIARLERQLRT